MLGKITLSGRYLELGMLLYAYVCMHKAVIVTSLQVYMFFSLYYLKSLVNIFMISN